MKRHTYALCLTLFLLYATSRRKVAELEQRCADLERERDQLRDARLSEQRPATLARITAERHVHRGYTEAGLLRMAGLKDAEE